MKKERTDQPGRGKILDAWMPREDSGEPIGCVATSFTFSPAFFEQECLGRFLCLETNAAEDGPAFLLEREEKLAKLSCAAALVDQQYARGMRNLRWDLLAARLPRGILHAKVSLLWWSNHVRLIVASANLTDDGYRRNHEVFAALDYFSGSDAPLPVLSDTCQFLREAVQFARRGDGADSPAVARWRKFVDELVRKTRDWGVEKPPRNSANPRITAVFSGPGRPSVFDTLDDCWPGNSPPSEATVISPFFDPPEAANEPARQIWQLLKQRGAASVEYDVTAEEVPGESAILIHAPESLLDTQPKNREQLANSVKRLDVEPIRPLHAKCLRLENEQFLLQLIGSSNFTSAGLGLGKSPNLEANLAFIVAQSSSDANKALRNAWLPVVEIPDDVERRWQPLKDTGDDSAGGDWLLLPPAFADAIFDGAAEGNGHLTFTFNGQPPADWKLLPEDADQTLLTESQWQSQGCPVELRLPWPSARPPSMIRVCWAGSGGFADWPVNVADGSALPPPDELKDLRLELLIDILTSAKPLHHAVARWLKRSRGSSGESVAAAIDPHERVDTTAFLLQRTRRVSWALSALQRRLEQPVYSEPSLTWRLRGPIGVLAFAQAIRKEARSATERSFLLTELCLDLARVRPQVAPGSLSKSRVRQSLLELVQEIRREMSLDSLAGEPELAAYAKRAFDEVLA